MAESEVQATRVGVGALPGQLAGEPVHGLEPDLLARRHLGDRLEVRVPAVVAHSSSATAVAVVRHASISASVQRRGVPSWCSETIPATRPSMTTGVTICAASPP